tara:strand:+ start:135 stop:311 length:177 start_codon:yes stop_codon:yes gene_type:complete
MKKIIVLAIALVFLAACYLPTGNYRVTDIRFNGKKQIETECVVMTVQGNVLTCQKEDE